MAWRRLPLFKALTPGHLRLAACVISSASLGFLAIVVPPQVNSLLSSGRLLAPLPSSVVPLAGVLDIRHPAFRHRIADWGDLPAQLVAGSALRDGGLPSDHILRSADLPNFPQSVAVRGPLLDHHDRASDRRCVSVARRDSLDTPFPEVEPRIQRTTVSSPRRRSPPVHARDPRLSGAGADRPVARRTSSRIVAGSSSTRTDRRPTTAPRAW